MSDLAKHHRWRLIAYALGKCLFITTLIATLDPRYSAATPRAELLVIGPSDTLIERFGHIELRIKSKSFDQVYNLGVTASSSSSGLLWSHIRGGRVELLSSSRSFRRALELWRRQERSVTLYPLMLTRVETQALYRELESRVHGRSPPYLYEFLRSNGVTQVRTLLDGVTHGALSRSPLAPLIAEINWRDELRFRYAQDVSILLALEFILGPELDQTRSLWELSVAPSHLIDLLRGVKIKERYLLGEGRQIYLRHAPTPVGGLMQYLPLWFGLWVLLWLGVTRSAHPPTLVPTMTTERCIIFWCVLRGSILILGGLSITAWFLSFKSLCVEARQGWFLYLAAPTDLTLLFIGSKVTLTQLEWSRRYLLIRGALSLLLTASLALIFEALPPFTLLSLALGLWASIVWCMYILRRNVSRFNYERSLIDSPYGEVSWL